MRALKLDFCRTSRKPRWLSPLLLAVAVAFSGDVAFSFVELQRDIHEKKAALAKLDPRSFRPARAVTLEEVALARDTLQRLATPWNELFGALEAAASDQVALLAIEPDPKAGTVTISGDSKDYLSALTYVLNLSRAEALSKVHLSRHETKADPGGPVAFSVSAAWKGARQ
jgi:hypothetical protein